MKSIQQRKADLAIVLPVVVCLLVYLLLVAVMYRHLPERLPYSMEGTEVTQWIGKSHLWKEPLAKAISLAVCIVVFLGMSKVFRRKETPEGVALEARLARVATVPCAVGAGLAALALLFDGLKMVFYRRFHLFDALASWALALFFICVLVLLIGGLAYAFRQRKRMARNE